MSREHALRGNVGAVLRYVIGGRSPASCETGKVEHGNNIVEHGVVREVDVAMYAR
jgi:hypothetical protein